MPDWSAAGSNVNARLLVVACVALWWSCQVGSEPVPHMAHGAADHEGSKEDGRAESLVVAGDAAPGPDRELQRRGMGTGGEKGACTLHARVRHAWRLLCASWLGPLRAAGRLCCRLRP